MEHSVRSKTFATRSKRARLFEDIHNTLTVPCEKSKIVSFASSIMEKTVLFHARSKFAVK